MANEEVLGPRKTAFVIVIVVGCFAVLWPRIISPMVFGGSGQAIQPNKFDREAGCCEVIYESEIAVLDILNEVCSSAVRQIDGSLSPFAAAECRRAVNETCGLDIAAFLKRSDNVGKTTKTLLETMKASNGSCLKEHFGVPVLSLSTHPAYSWLVEKDTIKQERPPLRGGPHPALRERGRAIPPGGPPPPRPSPLPPHIRVRSSPLDVYFELDFKPPPIPGMRPPLGGAGGPVQAPKSSMGFVMPIYTICIIVFFVYTLSKILFKRTGTAPYEHVSPDPHFRRRVFRDDSRSSPDKLGPKERDTIVTAISGLVAEVQQQMEASYAQNQQRQDVQDNHARPYTNGTILHSGPVQIVASEYREPSKDKSPEPQKKEPSPEPTPEPEKPSAEEYFLSTPEKKEPSETTDEKEPLETTDEKVPSETPEENEPSDEKERSVRSKSPERSPSPAQKEAEKDPTDELIKLTEKVEAKTDSLAKLTDEFLAVEKNRVLVTPEKQSTPELLEEALKEDSPVKNEEEDEEEYEEEEVEEEEEEEIEEPEKSSVKVLGMETTAHTADGRAWPRGAPPPTPTPHPPARATHEAQDVKSIYLESGIPPQSRVLVADFVDKTDKPSNTKHSPMVVSGKMTLSLIQDDPRDTPEKDLESTTVDDYTTASAVTQGVAEKEDNLSDDEEVDEEIEVEEIEEEVSEEEEEEEPPKKPGQK